LMVAGLLLSTSCNSSMTLKDMKLSINCVGCCQSLF
jgi:hypothetical protein